MRRIARNTDTHDKLDTPETGTAHDPEQSTITSIPRPKVTVGTKLLMGFPLVLVVFLGVSVIAFVSVGTLEEDAAWVSHTHAVVDEVDGVLLALVNIETGMRGFVATGIDEFLEPYDAGLVALDQHFVAGRTLTLDNPAQTQRWDALQPKLGAILEESERLIDIRRSEGAEAGADAVAEGRGKAIMDDIRASLDELRAEEADLLVVRSAATASSVERTKAVIVIGLLLGVAIVLGVAGYYNQSLAAQLRRTTRQARKTADVLTSVAASMSTSAEQTSNQASMASGAGEEVLESVSAVAVAIEQMSATVNEIAATSSGATEETHRAVTSARDTSERIARLGASSHEIGEVLDVINAIARQTNLLALNATIEAARAGEAGKGFSVVASEVKDLASQTAKATDEIVGRVTAIQQDVDGAVAATERIVETIGTVSDNFGTIAASVEEQSMTMQEINSSITDARAATSGIAGSISQVAEVADQTREATDETRETAVEVSMLADQLGRLVKV